MKCATCETKKELKAQKGEPSTPRGKGGAPQGGGTFPTPHRPEAKKGSKKLSLTKRKSNLLFKGMSISDLNFSPMSNYQIIETLRSDGFSKLK